MAALGAYGGMEMFELMNKRNCMLVRRDVQAHLWSDEIFVIAGGTLHIW